MVLRISDSTSSADAAAGVLMAFYRTPDDFDEPNRPKRLKTFTSGPVTTGPPMTEMTETCDSISYVPRSEVIVGKASANAKSTVAPSKALSYSRKGRDPIIQRAVRLEQNRRAAKDSRQRKNKMISELQGNVIFFSRANATLKQQNDELARLVMEAGKYVSDEGLEKTEPVADVTCEPSKAEMGSLTEMKTESATATSLDSKPDSILAASEPGATDLSDIKPGSTMQEMASFQQATAAAMHQAYKGLQNSTNLVSSLSQFPPAPQPTVANIPSHQDAIYRDAVAMLMMQQAAAVAAVTAGNQQALLLSSYPFMMGPLLAWQQQQQIQACLIHHVNNRSDNEVHARN